MAEVENSGALRVRWQVPPLEVGVEGVDPQLLLVVLVRKEPVVTLVSPQIKAIDPLIVRFLAFKKLSLVQAALIVIDRLLIVHDLFDFLQHC